MKIKMQTQGYEILEAKTVLLLDEGADFTLEFIEGVIHFKVALFFENDESGKTLIFPLIQENTLKLRCTNFSDLGSGTTVPIEIATIKGKKLYIHFWSYLEGQISGKKRVRKIEYTLLKGGI